jgi:hypothetical protein
MTRVRKNLPPLTLRLSAAFVKVKTPVSTGFLRFSLVFLWKTVDFAVFGHRRGPETRAGSGSGAFAHGLRRAHRWPEV